MPDLRDADIEAPLDIERIERECTRRRVDVTVHYRPALESSNDEIRLFADKTEPGVIALFTDFQRSGRGRQGRNWVAPACSSILASISMPWNRGIPLTYCTMLAALSVSDAISAVTGTAPELKWPNDVLVHGRKVAGILAESDTRSEDPRVILGMGINCNFQVEDVDQIPPHASTLQAELGYPVDRAELGIVLLERLQQWTVVLSKRPAGVFEAWRARLETLGSKITVYEGDESWEGTAVGVEEHGGLVVETLHGPHRTVYAANISIRARLQHAQREDQ